MNWENLDWEVLDRLRETFLTDAKSAGPYWHTITDLECYDCTFGERIGWKWDAVLAELKLRGWTPPAGATVLDWGCGSGIAGRRVIDFFGATNFSSLELFDHSALAMDFAQHRAKQIFPALPVNRTVTDGPIGVLVISHVLNELDADGLAALRALAARAEVILWVEPGTHEASRALGGWRERLGGQFNVVAPCTHRAACGVLALGNERHWCHFFGGPPAGVLADSGWVKFGQRAGIDLRSLPYSFLALDGRKFAEPAGFARIIGDQPSPSLRPTGPRQEQGAPKAEYARIIGEPRMYKGFAKIFSCAEDGVADLTLQKRDAPEVFKALKRADGPLIYRWSRTGDRVSAVEPRFS
jgi:hypothetical protein